MFQAGWYADPYGSGGYRWWDGTRWTEHLNAPPPQQVQAPAVQQGQSAAPFAGPVGPGEGPIDTFLILSASRARQEQRFASVQEVARIDCGDCMPYENGLKLFACRGLKKSFAEFWLDLRHYD